MLGAKGIFRVLLVDLDGGLHPLWLVRGLPENLSDCDLEDIFLPLNASVILPGFNTSDYSHVMWKGKHGRIHSRHVTPTATPIPPSTPCIATPILDITRILLYSYDNYSTCTSLFPRVFSNGCGFKCDISVIFTM